MSLYIQSNLTIFPSASAITADAIKLMVWTGFSADTTHEEIIAAGYSAVADPVGEQPADTTLVVNKNESNELVAEWMPTADYQELLHNRALAGYARNRRTLLLQQSDWTQGKDIPNEVSAQWTTYRQALRDITSQAEFPQTINWPQKPE